MIPWAKIAGFRHRAVHDYFGLDLDSVWRIASTDVPFLRNEVAHLLTEDN